MNIYDLVDIKTHERITGTAEELAKLTNRKVHYIRECALLLRIVNDQYRVEKHEQVWKITLPYRKVKIAHNRFELEEIFGYSSVTICNELKNSKDGKVFGCLIERVSL